MKAGQSKATDRFIFHIPLKLNKEMAKDLQEIQEYFDLTNRSIGLSALKLFCKTWKKKKEIMENIDNETNSNDK